MLIIDKLVVKQRPDAVEIVLTSGDTVSWSIDDRHGCIFETGSAAFKISIIARPQEPQQQQQQQQDESFELITDAHKSYIIRIDMVIPWHSIRHVNFAYSETPILEPDSRSNAATAH